MVNLYQNFFPTRYNNILRHVALGNINGSLPAHIPPLNIKHSPTRDKFEVLVAPVSSEWLQWLPRSSDKVL